MRNVLSRFVFVGMLSSLGGCGDANNENNRQGDPCNNNSNNNSNCGSNNNNNNVNNDTNNKNNNNGGPTSPNNEPYKGPNQWGVKAKANLKGAFGLLVMDDDKSSGLTLAEEHNKRVDELGLVGAPKFEFPKKQTDIFALIPAEQDITLNGKIFGFGSKKTGFALLDETSKEEEAKLKKIDKTTGAVADALTQVPPTEEQNNCCGGRQQLPNLLTLAVSPTKEVYLHFENPFIYRDVPQGEDGWDQKKGFQCQIFKVKGGTLDDLLTSEPEPDNLECLDNAHFINGWSRTANSVFQFDDAGNVYYPGTLPGNGKMAVYRMTRDGSQTSEVINANICVQDFLVTPNGGIFYTGSTCDSSGGGNNGQGGFFRYVAPGTNGAIIEIARNWWNFIYDTTVKQAEEGEEGEEAASVDQAVFFGPDPRSAATASWETACLFNFDPSQDEPSTRISPVITCGNDIWGWMDLRRQVDVDQYGEGYNNYTGSDRFHTPSLDWKKEYKRRCETKDQVFAGGGSQINAIKQDSTGEVYVIGNIRKKAPGILMCNIEMRGPHCKINGEPVLALDGVELSTQTLCSDNAGTWVDEGNCSNGSSGSDLCLDHDRTYNNNSNLCTSVDDPTTAAGYNGQPWNCVPTWNTNSIWYNNVKNDICVTDETGSRETFWDWSSKVNRFTNVETDQSLGKDDFHARFIISNFSCTPESGSGNNNNWTTEYRALAKVNKDTASLQLLSTETEQAISVWIVEDQVFYSSFDTTLGQYLLNGLNTTPVCVDSVKDTVGECTSAIEGEETRYSWSERKCIDTSVTEQDTCEEAGDVWVTLRPYGIISDFETYNLAPSGSVGYMFADGLDFTTNKYKFGTIGLESKTLQLKQGLTGTVKTIVVLPQD